MTRVVGDKDQFEESAVAGGTDGDEPALAAVVLFGNAQDVAPGVEDVGVRYAVLAGADSDLHNVKNARHPRIRQGLPDGLGAAAVDAAGSEPGGCGFVDDTAGHVAAAEAVGLVGRRYVSPAGLVGFLTGHGLWGPEASE